MIDVTGFTPVTAPLSTPSCYILLVLPTGTLLFMTYNSTFQDRAAQSAQAKKDALERYRTRPPVDDQAVAERVAAGQARDAAKAEKAATKKADQKAAEDAAAADAQAKADAAAAVPTEAERKAARDARYAKRKNRR